MLLHKKQIMNRLKDLGPWRLHFVYCLNTSSVVEGESLKSIPVREMKIKLKKLLSEDWYVKLGASTVEHVLNVGNIALNRAVEMIKEDGIGLEKKGAQEEVQFNPQHYILIGYRQKGMNIKFDIGSIPSGYSKMFATFKQIIQKITTESSIPSYMSYIGKKEWSANLLENNTCIVAEWIISKRNQHELPTMEDNCSILLKLFQGGNILSIQPLKVIEFAIDSSCSSCNISSKCKAFILKLYECLTKENEKLCTTFLSAIKMEELINIDFYVSELLRPLISKTFLHTDILEKLTERVFVVEFRKNYAIRSNEGNHSLGIFEVAECLNFYIICHIFDCDNYTTNIHILKQHRKTPIALHKLYLASVFCDKYGLKECLSKFDIGNIGDNFLSNNIHTEINELSFDVHVLTKHILLPILLKIQDKKEEKPILLQWINSCDAKYQSIINLSETALEQIIRMTNWSIFPPNLSLKEVLTNSKLKEQIFHEFVESNYNELVRTSCHTHDERICQEIVEKSCHTHDERICQEIVEKSCYEVDKNNNTLNMIEDITRQGYQSCLEFLEIVTSKTRDNLYKSFADTKENLHKSIANTRENLHKSFTDKRVNISFGDSKENLYMSFSDAMENLYIIFGGTRENSHISCAETRENMYKSFADISENLHISFDDTMENNLYPSFGDAWDSFHIRFADTSENLYKTLADSRENLHIRFADTRENLHKSCADTWENLYISIGDRKENFHISYGKIMENLLKGFVDSRENLPISFADTKENSYKNFVDSWENLPISFADTKENSYKSFDNTRENLHKGFAKAIHEDIYLQLCKDTVLQWSCECCSYHHHNSTNKYLCLGKTFCIQMENSICHFENKNLSKMHYLCRCHENLCSDVSGNIHLHHKNEGKLFLLEEIAVSNSSNHIILEDFQSEHIPFVKEGRVTECQLTLTERCNAVLGITFTLTQCMIAFLQKILQRNDCKQHETDCKQHETDCKQHETDCKQHETDCKQHETDCKQHVTEEHVRKQTATNLCLVFGIISCNQILKNIVKEKENVLFSGKLQKLSVHRNNGNKKLENTLQKDKLMDLYDILQTDNSKCIKSELYNIINHNSIFRNDEITAYPVNGYNGMSNEILRVGSLNNFPSENSPSLIKLAKYGFYYEGKGREVTCFSCGIKHDDWSYQSNPLEVHRQISPYCEYLKTLTPSDQPVFRPPREIIESDCRHNATPRMPTTEIPYQNGIGTDSIHTCTDAHGTPMTVAVQSVDSGLFGSSLSHSSNNLVTSNSTSISSISQRSSRASTDSGFGSRGSISTDNSSSSSHNSNLAVPQLPPLLEGGEHSIQRVSGPASRDSPIPQNNRKNTPKEKYPEYIPIERRRATYKNWPPNLDFLHPLDLSECGFFYSNFGDCVRCFHCGIGLRNWESDDNPWVEHARWSRKCPFLLQRKGQEFIDSVLSVLGLQTDSEIEMQTANAGTEPASQVSSGYGTASANDVRDPICHPAAQYIIRENIFGDNKEKQVKKTMNQLLQNHEWDDITNDMLVNALLESKDIMENLDTKTNSLNLSESAVSKSSASSHSNTQSTKPEDKNKEEESKKSGEEDPDKIQKENEELKDLYTCKICLDERVGITFVPCGHLVTCKDCSPKIRRCPLCRTFIRGTIKTTM